MQDTEGFITYGLIIYNEEELWYAICAWKQMPKNEDCDAVNTVCVVPAWINLLKQECFWLGEIKMTDQLKIRIETEEYIYEEWIVE